MPISYESLNLTGARTTGTQREPEAGRALDATQPCLLCVLRNAANARVTIAPIVNPLLFA
jgi:hypothetical protein